MISKRLAGAVESEFNRLVIEQMRGAVKRRDVDFGLEGAKHDAALTVISRVKDVLDTLETGIERPEVDTTDDGE